MKALITGGTGILGSALVDLMTQHGADFCFTSRYQPEEEELAVRWKKLNLRTGEGMKAAVDGAKAVIHLASDTEQWSPDVDIRGTGRLLRAAAKAGVEHFIYISIVGTDRVPLKYYLIKARTEQVVSASGLPFTILRTTQFHPFLEKTLRRMLQFPIGMLPKTVKIQPIDPLAVAQKLYLLLQDGPQHETLNIGGPEIWRLGDLTQAWLQHRQKKKWILHFPLFGSYRQQLYYGALTCPEKAENSLTWVDWLKKQKEEYAGR